MFEGDLYWSYIGVLVYSLDNAFTLNILFMSLCQAKQNYIVRRTFLWCQMQIYVIFLVFCTESKCNFMLLQMCFVKSTTDVFCRDSHRLIQHSSIVIPVVLPLRMYISSIICSMSRSNSSHIKTLSLLMLDCWLQPKSLVVVHSCGLKTLTDTSVAAPWHFDCYYHLCCLNASA